MEDRRFAKIIGDRLIDKGFSVARTPDHPYLLTVPDLLVGKEGSLVAFFIPKAHEQRDPDQILVRLILSRLALPPHLRCVLLTDTDRVPIGPIGYFWEDNFHEVLAPEDQKNLDKFVSDKKAGRSIQPIDSEIRRKAFARTQLLLRETLRRDETRQKGLPLENLRKALYAREEYGPTEIHRWWRAEGRREQTVYRSLRHTRTAIVSLSSFTSPHRYVPKLQRLFYPSIKLLYEIDLGAPYTREQIPLLILTDNLPSGRNDPLKPLRAAAFAGWIITRIQSVGEVDKLADRVHRQIEKIK